MSYAYVIYVRTRARSYEPQPSGSRQLRWSQRARRTRLRSVAGFLRRRGAR